MVRKKKGEQPYLARPLVIGLQRAPRMASPVFGRIPAIGVRCATSVPNVVSYCICGLYCAGLFSASPFSGRGNS